MSTRRTSGSKTFANKQRKTKNTNSFNIMSSMDFWTTKANYLMIASVAGEFTIS